MFIALYFLIYTSNVSQKQKKVNTIVILSEND